MLKMYTLHIISHYVGKKHPHWFTWRTCFIPGTSINFHVLLKISTLEIVNCEFLIGWNGWEVPTKQIIYVFTLINYGSVIVGAENVLMDARWYGARLHIPNTQHLELWLLKVGYIDLFEKLRLF